MRTLKEKHKEGKYRD